MNTSHSVPELPTGIESLALRPLQAQDAAAYYELTVKNLTYLTAMGDYQELKASTLEHVEKELSKPGDGARYGVWVNNSLTGRVDLSPREPGEFVLGYWLAEKATGKGYATAACKASIDYGKKYLGATDIYAGVTKGNIASERLLDRLGLKPIKDMDSYTRYHLHLEG